MSDTEGWRAPGADDDGFVDFETLQQEARALDRDAFAARYPVPALRVVYRDDDLSDGVIDPLDSGVQLLTMSIKSKGILRYLNRVAFVAKRPGNPFAHLISIGRSMNNDVVIAIETVSKVHGYFVRDDGGLSFSDHSSTNGSKLNGTPLEPGEKTPLADGDLLQLGIEVHLEIHSPEGLWTLLTGGRGAA